MPFAELDELYGLVSKDDQAILDQVLSRNEAAKTALAGREALYKAFVNGNEADIDALAVQHKKPATVINGGGGTGVTTDIAALEAKWNADWDKKFGAKLSEKAFEDVIEAVSKRVVEAVKPAFEGEILGKAAKTSDSVYQTRRSHEREFGEELDTAKFTEFIEANKGQFADLTAAHNAFVADKRIQMKIDQGIAKGLEDKAVANIPGSDLPKQDTVMAGFVRKNAELTRPANAPLSDAANRGVHLDAAVRAFRATQSGQNGILNRR